MKRKYITLFIAIIAVATVFFVAYRFSKKPVVTQEEKPKQPIDVTVQSVGASNSLTQKIEYPATIVGDQEVKVTAKSSGTAQEVNYELGQRVSANATLVRIDDTGNNLEVGDEGFRNADVQQAELSVEQYEEQLKTARKTRNKLNSAYQTQKKNPSLTKTVSKAQLIAAEGQVEVAEVQLENAKVALKGGLDDHEITSPISGYIVKKSIAVGDSITAGQELYTISKTSNVKIQFFVNQDQLSSVAEGMEINVKDNDGNSFSATVRNISPDADATTKRFLVEARPNDHGVGQAFPEEQSINELFSGSIVTVSFSVTKKPQYPGDLILPLTAITIGQNESYIFLAENGKAKKVTLAVSNVQGDTAEVKADVPPNAAIIINGSKLVQDGGEIKISD